MRMNKLKSRIGMTMAEMLIVVAIIGVLGGVAFVAVWNYQRSMGQLERDGIAKEIFVAAQNHLTAAYGEGYLGITEYGDPGTADEDTGKEVYYFTVNGSISENSVLGQMLPFGSVDETVRAGGSYIVRYQKDTGLVLDVFYCTRSGSPTRFNHNLADDEYKDVLALRDTESANHKQDRRNWNDHILGWYGGTEAALLATATLQPPTITVYNEEKLFVEVNNPNTGVTDSNGNPVTVSIRLLVKGLSSGIEHYINVEDASQPIILDDITSSGNTNGHFGSRRFDDMTTELDNGFIPGENIEVQAVAFSTSTLVNTAYSNKVTTNSLFESIADLLDATGASGTDKVLETAYIGNIRHLENLDAYVSNLKSKETNATGESYELFSISAAKQTTDFSWNTFKEKTNNDSTTVYYSSTKGNVFSPSTPTTAQSYYPIEPDYALTYDGQGHSISGVTAKDVDDAGLFGSTSNVTAISNLELLDFSITGTTSAGALAGTLNGCTVTNALARNSTNTATNIITAPTAGGLIGDMSGTVQYSAAAVVVNGSTTAGGLVGTASGPITGCYSGGHTASGSYNEWVKNNAHPYDVTGGTVGGLVGSSSAAISNSYSTCSVSGTRAGGLAGTVSGSVIDCYATGLVKGTSSQYALIGEDSLPTGSSGNFFYRVINEVPSTKANAKEGDKEPMLPVSGYELNASNITNIQPIDLNADSYNKFVGAWDDWNPARAYDSSLVQYYSGSYTLRTVDELNSAVPTGYENWNQLFVKTHYGDWPSPEVFFINE